ncbi:hypothetical protein RQP46_007929 [Phenoliferia psychrophenolica]
MSIDPSASAEPVEDFEMTGVEVELDLSASLNELSMGSSASVEVNIASLSKSKAGRAQPDDMGRRKPYQRPVAPVPEDADDPSLDRSKVFESVGAVLASLTLTDSAATTAPAELASLSAMLDLLSVVRPTEPVPEQATDPRRRPNKATATSTSTVATPSPPPPPPTRPSFFLNPLTILPSPPLTYAGQSYLFSTDMVEPHDLPSRIRTTRIVRPPVGPFQISTANYRKRREQRFEANLFRDMKQWNEPGAKAKREAREAADKVAKRAARKLQQEADRAREQQAIDELPDFEED